MNETSASLRRKAEKCRHLAGGINNPHDVRLLLELAADYEKQAAVLDAADSRVARASLPALTGRTD